MATIEEKIEEAEKKLKQLKAKKQKEEAQKRAALAKQERANDTRRKILAGALALDMMNKDESAKQRFLDKLDKFLTRDDDRALFDLPKRVDKDKPIDLAQLTQGTT